MNIPELAAAYGDLCKLYEKQLLTKCEVLTLFQTLFSKNEKKLKPIINLIITLKFNNNEKTDKKSLNDWRKQCR